MGNKMKSKSIIYLLLLLIFTQTCFQGCAVVSRNVKEKSDIYNAKNLGSCSLSEIGKGDFVEFKLDDGKTVSGKIVGIKRGEMFYIRDYNSPKYSEETEIKWDRIISAEKLKITRSKTSFVLPCGIGIVAIVGTLLIIAMSGLSYG